MALPVKPQLETIFDEIENEVTRLLRNRESYLALVHKRSEIKTQYPFIQSIFEGNAGIFSSDNEHRAWLDVKQTYDETERMERMALYFQGHADCYAYLRKIGAL
ncbi:hypothetical protein MHB77_23660 [Paenibacillus sp. FSL K6-3166]|uniref:DUF6664 family protein n=1 Tax=unclassified Paenibacillus TaxID=185978 RepID=UPI000B9FA594|nr:hypothetical protein [Paenibacillus sp. VTT E-133291]OZQ91464.1 hypothetical protein CA598_12040 [Paenibacillus sp. VTT E-133291]